MNADKIKFSMKYSEILPDNDRVRKKLKENANKELELKKKQLEDEEERKREEFLKEEFQRQNEEKKQKSLDEQKNIEKEMKKAIVAIETGEGNLNEIFKSIWRNTSTYEINFSGVDLGEFDFINLMIIMSDNMSVLTLNMSKKNLNDDKAKRIADMLKINKKLRRLELEGNKFTSESCTYFAEALKVNNFLRYLDLENNILTDMGKNNNPLIDMITALEHNKMLKSLNLSNNCLDDTIAQKIISMLRKNDTLIHLELFENYSFVTKERSSIYDSKFHLIGSSVEHTESIKKKLNENREKDIKWRTKEWKERKIIKQEDLDYQDNMIQISHKKKELQMKVEERNNVIEFYNNKFDNELKDLEEQFQKNVEQFYIETRQRLDKKPKRAAKKKK